MSILDDIRADIVARHEQALKEVAAVEVCLKTAYAQAGEAEAELRAHDRAVGAMLQAESARPPAPAKRQRHDVRGIVLRNLGLVEGEGWVEESHLGRCISAEGVNAESLHSYLLRAVRAGEVERDGKSNLYRLPTHRPPLPEPAPISPEQQQDAAE